MKPIVFLGDSRDSLRAFPDKPRQRAGLELRAVQAGLEPDDWKPMRTIGVGVKELRVRDASGAYRVIYLATLPDRVLVLHAFLKEVRAHDPEGYRAGDEAPQVVDGGVMQTETFGNVFHALADTSVEAANMTARADLMLKIRERVRGWEVSQEKAAARLGLTRPRLNDLMRGKLDKFSLDALVNVAASAGFVLRIEVDDAA